jgi:hypothetical protein
MKALNAITKKNDSIMTKIRDVASSLVSSKKLSNVSAGSFGTNIPYSVYSRFDKSGKAKSEVDTKYDKTVAFINDVIANPQKQIMANEENMRTLAELHPELSQQIQANMLNKVSALCKSLPVQSPATYGKAELTTLEKANFVDCVEAALHPEKMFNLIQAGTITPSQWQYFMLFNPVMHKRLIDATRVKLSVSGVQSSTSSKIYSMTGIATAPVVSPHNLMKNAMNPTQGMPQSMGGAVPSPSMGPGKIRASGAEKSGFSDSIARKNTP